VLDVVVRNFNLDQASMAIMDAMPKDFLLSLPDTMHCGKGYRSMVWDILLVL
jgi:hypothetical protein